jgi:hypothetical protein
MSCAMSACHMPMRWNRSRKPGYGTDGTHGTHLPVHDARAGVRARARMGNERAIRAIRAILIDMIDISMS